MLDQGRSARALRVAAREHRARERRRRPAPGRSPECCATRNWWSRAARDGRWEDLAGRPVEPPGPGDRRPWTEVVGGGRPPDGGPAARSRAGRDPGHAQRRRLGRGDRRPPAGPGGRPAPGGGRPARVARPARDGRRRGAPPPGARPARQRPAGAGGAARAGGRGARDARRRPRRGGAALDDHRRRARRACWRTCAGCRAACTRPCSRTGAWSRPCAGRPRGPRSPISGGGRRRAPAPPGRGGRLLLLQRGAPERDQARGPRTRGSPCRWRWRTEPCGSRWPTTARGSTRRVPAEGTGLTGMRDRAGAVGGRLEVRSSPAGTWSAACCRCPRTTPQA